jgi:hypothetical protein
VDCEFLEGRIFNLYSESWDCDEIIGIEALTFLPGHFESVFSISVCPKSTQAPVGHGLISENVIRSLVIFINKPPSTIHYLY